MYYATFPLKMDTNLVFFICIILKTHRMNIYIQTYETLSSGFSSSLSTGNFKEMRLKDILRHTMGYTAQVDQTAQGLMCNRTLTFMAKTFIFMFRQNSAGKLTLS